MIDTEEFTEQELDPPAKRPVTSKLLPRKTNWPTDMADVNSTREETKVVIEIAYENLGQAVQAMTSIAVVLPRPCGYLLRQSPNIWFFSSLKRPSGYKQLDIDHGDRCAALVREATDLTFDGSVGPTGVWTCIGWAYLIELPDGRWLRRSGNKSGEPSNPMVAEFEGLTHGLRWFAKSSSKAMNAATPRIVVMGDSTPVINLLNGGSTRNKALRSLQNQALALFER